MSRKWAEKRDRGRVIERRVKLLSSITLPNQNEDHCHCNNAKTDGENEVDPELRAGTAFEAGVS